MNHLPRSAIDRMIDVATGFVPAEKITLRCPMCEEVRVVKRDPIDPESAQVLLFPCNKHRIATDTPVYLDAADNQIPFP